MHTNHTTRTRGFQGGQLWFRLICIAPPQPVRAVPASSSGFMLRRSFDLRGNGRRPRQREFDFQWPASPLMRRDLPNLAEVVVQCGDLVTIQYYDTPDRQLRIRISATENKPLEGIVNRHEPLGQALLGNGVGEEFEIPLKRRKRMGVIEQIERATGLPAVA
jgi:hypothetical protein